MVVVVVVVVIVVVVVAVIAVVCCYFSHTSDPDHIRIGWMNSNNIVVPSLIIITKHNLLTKQELTLALTGTVDFSLTKEKNY